VEREPLAQGPGRNTFHFDDQGRLWRVLEPAAGAKTLGLAGIMNDRLEAGRYSVNGGEPVEARKGQVEVPLTPGAKEITVTRVQR
jgi:hypothetical protein